MGQTKAQLTLLLIRIFEKGLIHMGNDRKRWIFPLLVVFVAFLLGACQKPQRAEHAVGSSHVVERPSEAQTYDELIVAAKKRAAASGQLSFVVLGDSRSDLEMARRVFGRAAREAPAFILHTGDLVAKGRTEEYGPEYFPLVKEVAPIPIIPVPGNHDSGPLHDFEGFLSFFGADRFSFVVSNCRFVGVNNGGTGGLTKSDLQFLDNELAKPGVEYKFVIMHVPPVFVELYGSKTGSKEKPHGFTLNADQFHDLMTRRGVREVFLGHDHGYASNVIDGVRYTITGGGGAHLYHDMPWLQPFYHYVVVRVTQAGILEEVVRMEEGDQWVRANVD
jgi:hypothetical protein